jgi:hypothetical protein
VLLDVGQNKQAAEQCERGLELARTERITFFQPRIEANLAIARLRLGELDVGPALERAAAYCKRHSEGHQLARCLEGLAELALARGDAAGCLSFAGELLLLVEPAGLRELAAQARRWRGEALLAQKHYAAAGEELLRAATAAEQIGRLRLAADARTALSRLGKLGSARHMGKRDDR